jgi:hypothetical protein
MAAGDITSQGTGTLTKSAPGAIATVTITDANVAATDIILLTPTSAQPIATADKDYQIYLASVGTGSFVVKSNRVELPSNITFNYVAIATA